MRVTCKKKYFDWLKEDKTLGITFDDIPFLWSKLRCNHKLMERYKDRSDPCHCVPIIMDEEMDETIYRDE